MTVAAKSAGESRLRQILDKTKEVSVHPKPPQFSILHAAAITGDKGLLQKWIKSSYFDKSSLDSRDKYGRTPLIFSVLGDNSECTDLLLKV